MTRILLVEPDFPIPGKSRNHKNFMPIGLLKIATYLRDKGDQIKLIRGKPKDNNEATEITSFNPEEIWITSLFTYWAKYVREMVQIYRVLFPLATIKVGGIYASLFPPEEVKEFTGCDEVHQGVLPEVEKYIETHAPAYDLIKTNSHSVDFQIIHASRGCLRKCPFCGTWEIEPEFVTKKSIVNEVEAPRIIFYDNNFLMNPYVENILKELVELREQGKVKWIESQSGLDGRILVKNPNLAFLLKKAGLRYPRIAWDWGYHQHQLIENQIRVLSKAGYNTTDIFIFMVYNHEISFEEMENKRISCWNWKTQISDCRFRPLNQLVDDYKPNVLGQTSNDYHISKGWFDDLVKQFRRNVRRQNIAVRMRYSFYSSKAEQKKIDEEILNHLSKNATREEKQEFFNGISIDYWFPGDITYPRDYYDK
ncbi:MAG: hypothetical protein A2029_02750 [Chloroflexi bacterium RBG_19FT_COMBO_47_9]|nr:MAG: hypothetical protein A2029_02750 [Chloroflexi bacterium RBG_19FT_COMBO_47_9]